ncbi:MAG: ABC transporter ATP-binding protein [Nitrospirae bacterium]|nr:ABC transporter ATP-binding protein [Nitrospirota bacterium]
MDNVIIDIKGLTKDFVGLKAVNNINLSVREGELRSIIGPNGAGKTTFFNLISGHLKPTEGQIIFKGKDISDLPVHKRSHMGISRSFQRTNIFPRLTTFENIRIAAQSRKVTYDLWGNWKRHHDLNEKAEELLRLIRLEEEKDSMAGTLSYGQQRYLEIGISLATDPEILLLDEPTAGMSPVESMQAAEFIKELSGKLTVMLVEHDMEVVMGISDSITVMHNGAILAEGTPSEIRCNQEVQRVYLREEICLR